MGRVLRAWFGVFLATASWVALPISGPASATAPEGDWVRQLGTANDDASAQALQLDTVGNAFIAGYTFGTLPGSPDGYAGRSDAFVAKYGPDGTRLWIRQLGSASDDYVQALQLDGASNAFIAGYTVGPLPGSPDPSAGGADAFVAKYSPDGTRLWVRQLGSTNNDYVTALQVDGAGNAFIAGYTYGTLTGSPDGYLGGGDMFVAKYGPDGTRLWLHLLGSAYEDNLQALQVDSAGNAFLAGYTYGTLLGSPDGYAGWFDAFVAKYGPDGTRLWVRQLGSVNDEWASALQLDSGGNAFIAGYTQGTLPGSPDPNAGTLDAFVAKYGPDGTRLWVRQLGSASGDSVQALQLDSAGNAFIAGYTEGMLPGSPDPNAPGRDAFAAKYGPDGTRHWVRQLGGFYVDSSMQALQVDSGGNAFIAGTTFGTLPGSPDPNAGQLDAFVATYGPDGTRLWVRHLGSAGNDNLTALQVDSAGNAFIAGYTDGTLPGSPDPNAPGRDAFVAKFDLCGTPDAPTAVRVGLGAQPAGGRLRVSWSPVPTAAAYEVVRDGVPGGATAETAFEDSGLRNGGSYSYAIRSVKTTSCRSALSSVQSGTTLSRWVSIADAAAVEGDSGTRPVEFRLRLSGVSATPVSVAWATAQGSAQAGDVDAASGTVVFAPGDVEKVVSVQVKGDTLREANETFSVNLSNPQNVTVADGQAVGTIIDNEGRIGISVDDAQVLEGSAGTSHVSFPVRLSALPGVGQTVRVKVATAAGTATSPSDFVALPLTQLVFAPGETTKTVNVAVNGDVTAEPNETFTLKLSSPSNAVLADSLATGTIVNDDGAPGASPKPAVSVSDGWQLEGTTGETTGMVFGVRLAQAATTTVRVTAATTNGTATAGSDYTPLAPTVVTFPPGVTAQIVSIPLSGDGDAEGNETFQVSLSGASGAVIADKVGLGTIIDEEGIPTVRVGDVEPTEPTTGAASASVPITLSAPPAAGRSISIRARTIAGSAAAGSDFTVTDQVVTFAAGETSKALAVPVLADATVDDVEQFTVELAEPVGVVTIADAAGTVILRDGTTGAVADLAVAQTLATGARVGAPASLAVAVVNNGPETAASATLTSTLPAGLIAPTVSTTHGTCTVAAAVVTCDLGGLAAAASATVTIVGTPTLSAWSTSSTASASSADPNPTNNTNNLSTSVAGPSCTIVGTSGPDTLTGTPSDDVICALGGDDTIIGTAGNDTYYGGPGTDRLSYQNSPNPIVASLALQTATGWGPHTIADIEDLTGSAYADDLRGDTGPNVLDGGDGADTLGGDRGADQLLGGNGNDILWPGRGIDNDVLNGGGGVDAAVYSNAEAAIVANLTSGGTTGQGTDTLSAIENLTGSNYADTITGSTAGNVLTGLAANDAINGSDGISGNDVIDGGTGTDTCTYDPGDVIGNCP